MVDDLTSHLPLTPAVLHILVAVATTPRHGYAIAREVESLTDGTVRMGPGTLYGSLQRMADAGLIRESDARDLTDVRRKTAAPSGSAAGGNAAGRDSAAVAGGGSISDPEPDRRAERRRYYEATPLGLRVLRAEAARLEAVVRLVESRVGS